jgi:hypothetical protein
MNSNPSTEKKKKKGEKKIETISMETQLLKFCSNQLLQITKETPKQNNLKKTSYDELKKNMTMMSEQTETTYKEKANIYITQQKL